MERLTKYENGVTINHWHMNTAGKYRTLVTADLKRIDLDQTFTALPLALGKLEHAAACEGRVMRQLGTGRNRFFAALTIEQVGMVEAAGLLMLPVSIELLRSDREEE